MARADPNKADQYHVDISPVHSSGSNPDPHRDISLTPSNQPDAVSKGHITPNVEGLSNEQSARVTFPNPNKS